MVEEEKRRVELQDSCACYFILANYHAYTTRVAFYYPENERKAWEAQRAAMVKEEKTVVSDLPPLTADKLNFGYALDGKDHFKPVRVFDDGAKVYIQMPMEFQHRVAPARDDD